MLMTWQWFVVGLLVLELIACLVIGSMSGFRYSIPLDSYLIVSAVFAVVFTYIVAITQLLFLKKQMPWRWVLETCGAFAMVAIQMALLSWTKNMMPHVTGFWADEVLADLDFWLFGADPWIWLHENLSRISAILDRAYISWAPIKFLTLLLLILMPQNLSRSRLLCTYFITVSLGAFGQYALPSAGPIFFERIGMGERYSAMPIAPWAEAAASYLWHDFTHGNGKIGTGISAMPSMHVATAAWIGLVVRKQLPSLQIFGWAYFFLICVGSVYLGWHYAIDIIGGVLAVTIAWYLAGQVTKFRRESFNQTPAGNIRLG